MTTLWDDVTGTLLFLRAGRTTTSGSLRGKHYSCTIRFPSLP